MFPLNYSDQTAYMQDLSDRLAKVQLLTTSVIYYSDTYPTQGDLETFWVEQGGELPVPVAARIYWQDSSYKIRGIFGTTDDRIALVHSFRYPPDCKSLGWGPGDGEIFYNASKGSLRELNGDTASPLMSIPSFAITPDRTHYVVFDTDGTYVYDMTDTLVNYHENIISIGAVTNGKIFGLMPNAGTTDIPTLWCGNMLDTDFWFDDLHPYSDIQELIVKQTDDGIFHLALWGTYDDGTLFNEYSTYRFTESDLTGGAFLGDWDYGSGKAFDYLYIDGHLRDSDYPNFRFFDWSTDCSYLIASYENVTFSGGSNTVGNLLIYPSSFTQFLGDVVFSQPLFPATTEIISNQLDETGTARHEDFLELKSLHKSPDGKRWLSDYTSLGNAYVIANELEGYKSTGMMYNLINSEVEPDFALLYSYTHNPDSDTTTLRFEMPLDAAGNRMYEHLLVIIQMRSSAGIAIAFNDDATQSNYRYLDTTGLANTEKNDNTLDATLGAGIKLMTGTASATTDANLSVTEITGINQPMHKNTFTEVFRTTSGSPAARITAGSWASTAPISVLNFGLSRTGGFVNGDKILVYGFKAQGVYN